MHELWSTVLAPVLDALRPALVLDVGCDGARLARLCARHVQPWGGRVLSRQSLTSEPAEANLRIEAIEDFSSLSEHASVEVALLHAEANWWSVHSALRALASATEREGRAMPVTLVHNAGPPWGRRDHYSQPAKIPAGALQPHRECSHGWIALHEGTPRNGVLAAVGDFARGREGLEIAFVPGLGGIAILVQPAEREDRLWALLRELSPPPLAGAQIELLEDRLGSERHRAERAEARAAQAEERALDRDMVAAERDELLTHLGGARPASTGGQPLVGAMNGAGRANGAETVAAAGAAQCDGTDGGVSAEAAGEPTQEQVRALLKPELLLAELGWPGLEQELAWAIPHDARGVVQPRAEQRIAVVAHVDAPGLRRTLCSVLERVAEPVALSLLLDDAATREVSELVGRIVHAVAGVELVYGRRSPPGARVLIEGEEMPWGTPGSGQGHRVAAVAYLLPGLPAEGSGGSHSLVQEARGLRQLGCQARICVPLESLAVASALYGNEDELFVTYEDERDLAAAVGPALVAIATEHPSLLLLERLASARPEIACAYYVQDYEPLFAPPESRRSDRALLSYGALPGQALFAKTHWLRNVVMALHGVHVAKVSPSLDRELFHAEGREEDPDVTRVAAMVRPRTPRRRPQATLQMLATIRSELGGRVRTTTFGCDEETYAETAASAGVDGQDAAGQHLGVLKREQVAQLMRSCDVFIDASAYQAFGRSGLEAMACGVVPVLPALGGVHEYAEHERNALILQDGRPRAMAEQVIALARDHTRLQRLREVGLRTAAGFSIERAAQSQLDLFSAVASRSGSATRVA